MGTLIGMSHTLPISRDTLLRVSKLKLFGRIFEEVEIDAVEGEQQKARIHTKGWLSGLEVTVEKMIPPRKERNFSLSEVVLKANLYSLHPKDAASNEARKTNTFTLNVCEYTDEEGQLVHYRVDAETENFKFTKWFNEKDELHNSLTNPAEVTEHREIRQDGQFKNRKDIIYSWEGKMHRDPLNGPAFAILVETEKGRETHERYFVHGVEMCPPEIGPATRSCYPDGTTSFMYLVPNPSEPSKSRYSRPPGDQPALYNNTHGRIHEAYYVDGKLIRQQKPGEPAQPSYLTIEKASGKNIDRQFTDENGELHSYDPDIPALESYGEGTHHISFNQHGKLHRDPKKGPAEDILHPDASTLREKVRMLLEQVEEGDLPVEENPLKVKQVQKFYQNGKPIDGVAEIVIYQNGTREERNFKDGQRIEIGKEAPSSSTAILKAFPISTDGKADMNLSGDAKGKSL
jgi:hypothetical protein